ncbi:MAG: histone [bacterium]|nr:histone [bacterium]
MAGRIISLAAGERLLKTSKAERISDTAIRALIERLERQGERIARRAWDFTRHAKRKTVTRDDVELACTEPAVEEDSSPSTACCVPVRSF